MSEQRAEQSAAQANEALPDEAPPLDVASELLLPQAAKPTTTSAASATERTVRIANCQFLAR